MYKNQHRIAIENEQLLHMIQVKVNEESEDIIDNTLVAESLRSLKQHVSDKFLRENDAVHFDPLRQILFVFVILPNDHLQGFYSRLKMNIGKYLKDNHYIGLSDVTIELIEGTSDTHDNGQILNILVQRQNDLETKKQSPHLDYHQDDSTLVAL